MNKIQKILDAVYEHQLQTFIELITHSRDSIIYNQLCDVLLLAQVEIDGLMSLYSESLSAKEKIIAK